MIREIEDSLMRCGLIKLQQFFKTRYTEMQKCNKEGHLFEDGTICLRYCGATKKRI